MNDVVMSDVMQKEAPLPAEEVAVDGACGTSLEGPLALAKMRKLRVGVVKVSDHNKLDRVCR